MPEKKTAASAAKDLSALGKRCFHHHPAALLGGYLLLRPGFFSVFASTQPDYQRSAYHAC